MLAVAYRVPVADGSVSDITFKLMKGTSTEEVRDVLENAIRDGIWEIVKSIKSSADIIGNTHDAVVERGQTVVIDQNIVCVRSGYDNAYAPARAALDAMQFVLK